MNKELIKRVQNREAAIKSDGTLDELNQVLKACFPEDDDLECSIEASSLYYAACPQPPSDLWFSYNNNPLPSSISVTDFFQEEWKPKFGEEVMIRDHIEEDWEKFLFIGESDSEYRYIVTDSSKGIKEIRNGEFVTAGVYSFKHIKPC